MHLIVLQGGTSSSNRIFTGSQIGEFLNRIAFCVSNYIVDCKININWLALRIGNSYAEFRCITFSYNNVFYNNNCRCLFDRPFHACIASKVIRTCNFHNMLSSNSRCVAFDSIVSLRQHQFAGLDNQSRSLLFAIVDMHRTDFHRSNVSCFHSPLGGALTCVIADTLHGNVILSSSGRCVAGDNLIIDPFNQDFIIYADHIQNRSLFLSAVHAVKSNNRDDIGGSNGKNCVLRLIN